MSITTGGSTNGLLVTLFLTEAGTGDKIDLLSTG
jgi:hypothetical protein